MIYQFKTGLLNGLFHQNIFMKQSVIQKRAFHYEGPSTIYHGYLTGKPLEKVKNLALKYKDITFSMVVDNLIWN